MQNIYKYKCKSQLLLRIVSIGILLDEIFNLTMQFTLYKNLHFYIFTLVILHYVFTLYIIFI